tara:strand:- start:189 stop:803 length:615 start_codon:yes stop_codon:yes gene_type:complete
MQIIHKYFPDLSDNQIYQFSELKIHYEFWNSKINVISRKSIDNLYTNHILHSLSIAKYIKFKKGTRILDVGTGGGFPGIPLAIIFPEVEFVLVDSISKKIKVVNKIYKDIGLNNVVAVNDRAENINDKFDFVVSRAVTNMTDFKKLVSGKFKVKQSNRLDNGILYLKGGDLSEEFRGIEHNKIDIHKFFNEDFFKNKQIVHIVY